MAETNWTGGAADGNIDTAGNWDNGVPGAGSDVNILRGDDDILSGMNQSAISWASFKYGDDFDGTLGTPSAPLLVNTVTDFRYSGVNSKSFNFQPSAVTQGIILGTHPAAYSCYLLGGTWALLGISLAKALRLGSSLIATKTIFGHAGNPSLDVVARVESGATLTLVHMAGGQITSLAALGTIRLWGGLFDQCGSSTGDITAAHIHGGRFKFNAPGATCIEANALGGTFDCRDDSSAKTITNCSAEPGGRLLLINGPDTVVCTNPPKNYGGVVEYNGSMSHEWRPPGSLAA